MNTDLTTAAVERLTAQLGEALFGEPGLSLMEIANRRAEIEALVKDAGRYRWLRDTPWTDDCEVAPVIQMQMNSLWDKAIDAAMKEQAE